MESNGQRAARWFGRNVRSHREAAGISQAALGAAMRSRGYRWQQQKTPKIEKGIQAVTYAEAIDLAELLGVSLADLTRAPEQTAASRRIAEAARMTRQAHAEAQNWPLEFYHSRSALREALAEAPDLGEDLAGVLADARAAAELRLSRED